MPKRSSDRERDADIEIARRAAKEINTHGNFFILTGSYSIEALTNGDIAHNDIDANIFTLNIPHAIARARSLLIRDDVLPDAEETKKHPQRDRLEYEVTMFDTRRKLELQFVNFLEVREQHTRLDFRLPNNDQRELVVPTIEKQLANSSGEPLTFRVKSLPFAIATWALRISGVAQAQKRAVRQSDIKHFAFLARSPHDTEDVLQVMEHHPQMPMSHSAKTVLELAMQRIE